MGESPEPLSNGYLWVAHTFLLPGRLQVLKSSLADGVRHEMKTRDVRELQLAYSDEMELWVHPEDLGRVGPILRLALCDS